MAPPPRLNEEGLRSDGSPLLYAEYINVSELLTSLRLPEQCPRGQDPKEWPQRPAGWKPGDPWPRGEKWCHDEVLFITTHQVFEVWFRQVLHELDDVMVRAREAAAHQQREIPLVNLARRRPDDFPLGNHLERYPQLRTLAGELGPSHPLATTFAPAWFHVDALSPRLSLLAEELPSWTERIHRAASILTVCIPFFDVLSQMTPDSFLAFRDRLNPASGFGSSQFRQIEILLGLRERHLAKVDWKGRGSVRVGRHLAKAGFEMPEGPGDARESFARHYPKGEQGILVKRLGEPCLRDLLYWLLNAVELNGEEGGGRFAAADRLGNALYRRTSREDQRDPPHGGISALHERWRDLSRLLSHSEAVHAARLLDPACPFPALRQFTEACLTLDNALLSWRDTHLRFVGRMIGARPGTGGGGMKYLRTTVDPSASGHLRMAFPCLWEGRSLLVRE